MYKPRIWKRTQCEKNLYLKTITQTVSLIDSDSKLEMRVESNWQQHSLYMGTVSNETLLTNKVHVLENATLYELTVFYKETSIN